ncbi:MAG: alpha/beta hydrolase family protein [Gammaproteobacteria bacterium]
MHSHRVRFEGHAGLSLAGVLDAPRDSEPRAYAVLAHCFTCTKNLRANSHISRTLAREGLAVLRFDFAGLGESEGRFEDSNFSTMIEDVRQAARYLAAEHRAPGLLLGHSMGGTASLRAAPDLPFVRAVSVIGSPAEAAHLRHHFESKQTQIREQGRATIRVGPGSYTINQQWLDDLDAQPGVDAVADLGRALLILHSPLDEVVPIASAGRLYSAARHPKSFVSLDRADHLFSTIADAEYAARLIRAWSEPYLAGPNDV